MMEANVRQFLDDVAVGVLATIRADGSARQSVVYFVRDGERIWISTESRRGKARDVARHGFASLCVQGPAKPFPSVTVEGTARIVRDGIGEPTARVMERITGTRPEPATDADLAAVDRVVIEIDVDRVYGASYLPGGGR
jgi:PPOX class probable F420-dependent enzyme